MASILVVLTSSPASPAGQRALSVAESLANEGHRLNLICLQDAVLLGSDRSPLEARSLLDRLLARGATLAVLGEDLACRGLRGSGRAAPVNHAGVVALLSAEHDRVIGAL